MDSKNNVSVALQLTLLGSLNFGPLENAKVRELVAMTLRYPVITGHVVHSKTWILYTFKFVKFPFFPFHFCLPSPLSHYDQNHPF